MNNHRHHDDFGGLQRDLRATGSQMDRRRLFSIAARFGVGISALDLLACGASPTSPSTTSSSSSTGSTSSSSSSSTSGSSSSANSAACAGRVPEETQGPYPGDGSNGPNVLSLSGVVRSDLRSSFAGLSGTADGVPLTIALTLVSAATCAPLAGSAVYIWHCDRPGRYSLYSSGVTNQNFPRGVQEADGNGTVMFTSIFPGCYAGRWPHVHFEVYQNLSAATNVRNKIATSQIALPRSACDAVYATSGYEASVRNLAGVSLSSDMVFADGAALELATMSGSVGGGMTATLTVGI